MTVEVWIKDMSDPIVYEDAENTYEEGSFLCIPYYGGIDKYPVANIYRIIEFVIEDEEVI